MNKLHHFWSILMTWSIKTNLPLLLYLAYLPGFALCAVLIQNPFGCLGYIILLFFELWEIKALDNIDGRLSEIFLPVIIMHPYLCVLYHIMDSIIFMIQPNRIFTLSDSMLLSIRLLYVCVAFFCIILRKIYRTRQ